MQNYLHGSNRHIRIINYDPKIKHYIDNTLREYWKAIERLIPVIEKHWNEISQETSTRKRRKILENILKNTTWNIDNKTYTFKELHPMHSYYLRTLYDAAIGHVSSHKTRYQQWLQEPKKERGKAPKLSRTPHLPPSLYRDSIYHDYEWTEDGVFAEIRLLTDSQWEFVKIQLNPNDVKKLENLKAKKISAPTLIRKGNKAVLSFYCTYDQKLSETTTKDLKICAVDLGVNTPATAVIMDLEHKVINKTSIHDHELENKLSQKLEHIRQCKKRGDTFTGKKWYRARGLNEALSQSIARQILDFAMDNAVDVVVFEYLDLCGCRSGSQRIALWRYGRVQELVEVGAHNRGMRFSRVSSCLSSRLAWDGSGYALRGSEIGEAVGDGRKFGFGMLLFKNGKFYSADLNACYNLGARYFIRRILGELSEKVLDKVFEDMPVLKTRSKCCYNDLVRLLSFLEGSKVPIL